MVKRKIKISGIIILIIGGLYIWVDQSRSFYCLSDGKCVTVWKRVGGVSYIIPKKYYSLLNPKCNYIRTRNTGYIDIIWIDGNRIYFDSKYEATVVNQGGDILIEDYNRNRLKNDSAFTYMDGHYRHYNDDVQFVGIDIEENYSYSLEKKGKN